MALKHSPSQIGTVGQEGPVTDVNGDAAKSLIPAVLLVDGNGASAIGNTDDAAWNGTDPDASVIALLKAIALNTTPP